MKLIMKMANFCPYALLAPVPLDTGVVEVHDLEAVALALCLHQFSRLLLASEGQKSAIKVSFDRNLEDTGKSVSLNFATAVDSLAADSKKTHHSILGLHCRRFRDGLQVFMNKFFALALC